MRYLTYLLMYYNRITVLDQVLDPPQLLYSGLGKGIPLKDPRECEKTPEMNELERDKNRVKI